MTNRSPSPTPQLSTVLVIAILAAAVTPLAWAQRLPDLGDPDFEPEIDLAVQCLLDTRVVRFTAEPVQVEPFEATTLSWQVDVPPGCPMRLTLTGRTIDAEGSLEVVPVHEDNLFHLIAQIGGGTATLATTPVAVDLAGCESIPVPEADVAAVVTPLITALDQNVDAFEQTADPVIRVQSNGLFLRLFLKVDPSALLPEVDVQLDMLFRFTVRDGRVDARYGLFRPVPSTVLPDDLVKSEFFDRADQILANVESTLNSQIQTFVPNDRQLFDVPLVPGLLTIVHCPVEPPEPPPPPTLTVRLRVLPGGDPGRFNLRIDGVTLVGNAADGGSTGPREVTAGTHTVSQTAGTGTNLADYRTFIGGDCALDGRVSLAPGDAKLCFVTNVRQETESSCEQDCRTERDTCNQDPQTLPQICVQIFQACLATCN